MAIRDTSVVFFTSSSGIAGVGGSLISVLDTVLINGGTGFSIDSISVSGGIATATISGGHGLTNPGAAAGVDIGVVIVVSGVTGALASLNDRWRATITSSTVLTWECGLSDGSAAGTLAGKRAPAGWTKPYSSGNVAVYRSADPLSTQFYLRVDDSGSLTAQGARNAFVRGYESMTDVNTGTYPFPTAAQEADGCRWVKSDAADATGRAWAAVADGKTLYLHIAPRTTETYGGDYLYSTYRFGDYYAMSPSDDYNCLIDGSVSSRTANFASEMWWQREGGTIGKGYMPRDYLYTAGASTPIRGWYPPAAEAVVAWGKGNLDTPQASDGRVWAFPPLFGDSKVLPRGQFRGVYEITHSGVTYSWLAAVADNDGLPSTCIAMACGRGQTSSTYNYGNDWLVDLVGPWA